MIPKQLCNIFTRSSSLSKTLKMIKDRPDIAAVVTKSYYTVKVANRFKLGYDCIRYCNNRSFRKDEGV